MQHELTGWLAATATTASYPIQENRITWRGGSVKQLGK